MIANTMAKRKLLVCILLITLITVVYLPHMARQSSKLFQLREDDDQLMSRSARYLRPPHIAFRRRLQSPIHMRRKTTNHKTRVHKMYRDTIDRILRETETFRDFFHKSHGILPWPMRKMERLKRKYKYVIYRCDVVNQCGDWVNRVQGIVASYLLASLTNRTLKVEMLDSPCSVTSFLVPNVVNWSLPVSFHKKVVQDGHPNLVNFNPNVSSFMKQINQKLEVRKLFPDKAQYVYVTGSNYVLDKIRQHVVQNRMLDWMRDLNRTEIYSAMLKLLFRPTPSLRRQIGSFKATALTSPGDKLVCVSSSSNGNRDISNLLTSFVSLYANESQHKFFIMPDSLRDEIVSKARIPKERYVHKIENVLKDATLNSTGVTDQTQLKKCTKLEDIFSFMMSVQCDVILVTSDPKVRLAALSRGTDRGVVCLSKDGKSISQKQCL